MRFNSTLLSKNNKNFPSPPPPLGEGFVLKLRLAARKEDWLHLRSREEVLEILERKQPEGLFLRHPRWAFWDWDGTKGDQPLVDKAVRLVFARAGLKEGRDYRRLISGGKGIRVVTTFLTQAEEEAKLLQEHVYLIAEETWIGVDKKPKLIEELEEKLSGYEKERKERIRELNYFYEKKDWAGVRKVRSRLASLEYKISKLKEKISCYDAKNKRVKASLFVDKVFGNRRQPERILGWDGKKKWGRLLKVGQNITSVSHYRRLCTPPRDKAKATIKQAREILPSEVRTDEKLKRIIEAQKKRKQLLKKVAHKKFDWIFNLLDEETDKILARLEQVVWETKFENIEDIEELALTVFLATQKRIRNKLASEGVIGLKDECPACREKDKAYIKRVNNRYFLRCHRDSCTLNQSLVSYCIEKGLLSPDLLVKDKKTKKKIKRKTGLGNYLSPEFKTLSPKEAAEEALKILAKENNILISWLTGEGKTTFAAILAAKLGKKVWILCYSWEEALEFANLLKKLGVEPILVPSKKEECKNFKKIENVRERELADAHICSKCKEHPARGGKCEVIKTLTDPKPRIYIGVHPHLEFAKQHADLIIIDEVHELIKKEKIDFDELNPEVWYILTEDKLQQTPEAVEAAWTIYNYFQNLIPPALLKKEVLPEAIPTEIKEAANLLLSAIEKHIGGGKLHQARVALEDVNTDKSYVWRALSALSAIATNRAVINWSRKRNKAVGELLYYDASNMSNYKGKLVLLSATAPPSLVKNCLNLKKLNWKCYLIPRKGKIVGINTISSTGKLALRNGLTKPVQNALAISSPEAIVCYKQNKDEISNTLSDERIVTWGQHEGTNRLKDVSSLAIIGRPTPPPNEIVDWLLLTNNPAETLYWLLVSPLIQAVGRLRKLWKDENATIFLIDNHVLQLQKFLLSWLGPFDLIFWATDKQKDTERKVVALKEAIKEKERRKVEETFLNNYSMLAKQNGVSRQAINKFGHRLFSANAFAARWQKWWKFIKSGLKEREKPDFSELIDTFSQKILEFLPRIFPRRGPPRQRNFLEEVRHA